MAYEFKNLSEIPTQDAPTENTTVMVFENGNPRQTPAGEFGGKGLVVDLRGYTLNTDGQPTTISDINYDPIYEAIMAGQNVVFQITDNGFDMVLTVLGSVVTPRGLFTMIFGQEGPLSINFTNGSYHTTA